MFESVLHTVASHLPGIGAVDWKYVQFSLVTEPQPRLTERSLSNVNSARQEREESYKYNKRQIRVRRSRRNSHFSGHTLVCRGNATKM